MDQPEALPGVRRGRLVARPGHQSRSCVSWPQVLVAITGPSHAARSLLYQQPAITREDSGLREPFVHHRTHSAPGC